MAPVIDYTSAELLVIIGTVILLSLLLAEVFDWGRIFFACDNAFYNSCNYSYSEIRGPVTWKAIYPESRGDRQSPINIDCHYALVFPAETLPPLQFSAQYYVPPCDLRLYNDGHCVNLFARWSDNTRPTICGGRLEDNYQFAEARFRWGPNDEEGSEHTIDSHRYAMELQAIHVRADKYHWDSAQAAEENAVVIISYFFQVVPVDNPYLKPITTALQSIKCPFECVKLEPAPLSSLMPPFYSKYYVYSGSLTFPPCTEGVQWIIQPEPLGISSRQVRKFRKLCATDGPMEVNTRPVQPVNCRELCFYD